MLEYLKTETLESLLIELSLYTLDYENFNKIDEVIVANRQVARELKKRYEKQGKESRD